MRLRELIPKRMRRLQFGISDLFLLMTVLAVYFAILAYRERRRREVVRVYDAQKAGVIARRAGEEPLICYVEVMGFVSHDGNDSPNWMSNLPMTISARGKPLDERFIAILTRQLRERGWEYEVNDRCKWLGHFQKFGARNGHTDP